MSTVREKIKEVEKKSSESKTVSKVVSQKKVQQVLQRSDLKPVLRNSPKRHREIEEKRNTKIEEKIQLCSDKSKQVQKEEGLKRKVQIWDHFLESERAVVKRSQCNENKKGQGLEKEKGWGKVAEPRTKPNLKEKTSSFLRVSNSLQAKRAVSEHNNQDN